MIRTWGVSFAQLLAVALPATPVMAQQGVAIDSIRLQGYVQVQAEFGDATDTRFPANDRMFVRRARLYALGSVARDWEIRLMLDGAPGLTPRRDVPASLVEGYIRWKRYASATLQVGQYKTPFTHEESHSASQLLTIERSLVVDRLKPSRQVGILLSGTLRNDALRYGVGVFNGTGTSTNANDDERFLYIGRASVRAVSATVRGADLTWHVGASGLTAHDAATPFAPDFAFDTDVATPGSDNLFAGKRVSGALDSQLRFGRGELWTEYVTARFTTANAIPVSFFETDGWYVLVAWHLVPRRLQLVGRVEAFDQRRINDPGRTESLFLGANLYLAPGHDLKLQAGHMLTRQPLSEQVAHRLLLRAQVMFSIL
jgi:hypothetical protein